MARYDSSYTGERRSVTRTMKLTPAEDAALVAAASQQGTGPSTYARELVCSRSAIVVPNPQRNAQVWAVLTALEKLGLAVSQINNNCNQIARHLNTFGELDAWHDITAMRQELDAVMPQIREAIEKAMSL